MTQFSNMSSSVGYNAVVCAADVANLIDALPAILTTARGWTTVSYVAATSYRATCVSAGGNYCDMALTRTDADTISLSATDQNARSLFSDRRMDINAAGNTTVTVFSSKYGVWMISERATQECMCIGILDSTGYNGGDTTRVYANSSRTNAGTNTGFAGPQNLYMIDSANTTQVSSRFSTHATTGSSYTGATYSGAKLFGSIECSNGTGTTSDKPAGLLYDASFCSGLADGYEQGNGSTPVPIGGAGETGVFRATTFGTAMSTNFRICFRKS
jgi:hypothetical protein